MPHLANTVIDAEIDRVLLGQPEASTAATGRQQVVAANVGECFSNGPESGKGDDSESSQETLRRNHEAVLCLGCKHPAILVTACGVSTQIVRRAKEAQIINGNVVSYSSTTHGAKCQNVM